MIRNNHDPIRRLPIMQAYWFTCTHYIIKLTNSCYRTLHPASQDIRSLMSPEKQMSVLQPLVFP